MFMLLTVHDILKGLLRHHNSNELTLLLSAVFVVQNSHLDIVIGKTIAHTTLIFPRSIMHGHKRPFSIVFETFHINRITVVFCRIVSERKRSDTAFSHRTRSFSTAYNTVKYGRNAAHMKWVKYGPFTVINSRIRDGFQRIRSP